MIDEIRRHQEALTALCRKYKVARLELFGSATDETFDPETSDLDFPVLYQDLGEFEWSDCYFGLKFALEDMFDRHVDLVMLDAITNPYFRAAIESSRVPLYAAA